MIASVAIFSPIRDIYDYLLPEHLFVRNADLIACRVRIPFGHSERIGIILAVKTHSSFATDKLKSCLELLDQKPLISSELQALLHWSQQYYQAPIGGVFAHGFPARLRKANHLLEKQKTHFQLTAKGQQYDETLLKRAPRQRSLFQLIKNAAGHNISISELKLILVDPMPLAKKLEQKELIERLSISPEPTPISTIEPQLTAEQQQAVKQFTKVSGSYHCALLDGITGSGKTEVYIQIIKRILQQRKQVLLLVPEIGLTPQLLQRLKNRLSANIAISHSGLSPKERQLAWQECTTGHADILLGTRSTIFTSFPRLGLIIVDEEHDSSLKQQEGFRYSARDIAVIRGQKGNFPVLLGSATPSIESYRNAKLGRYQHLILKQRATGAKLPSVRVLDIRHQKASQPLSSVLIEAIRKTLEKQEQVIIFLNRRGYSPVLMCYQCGWAAVCQRCDSHMTWHKTSNRLWCHHCDAQRPYPHQCPDCSSQDIQPLGQGTQRLEQLLGEIFPDTSIARIDRDSMSTSRKFHRLLDDIHENKYQLLIGTQMLAKGHHFADVTLVAMLDIDSGLFSTDYRAPERLAQMIVQVSGRAGRESKPGQVIIQTRHPEHILLTTLLSQGYQTFAEQMMTERKLAQLPPYSYQALVRAESGKQQNNKEFMQMAIEQLPSDINHKGIFYLGPVSAPMPKRAGRYRSQLLLQANSRSRLQKILHQWIEDFRRNKLAKRIRWSIDVDPQDMM